LAFAGFPVRPEMSNTKISSAVMQGTGNKITQEHYFCNIGKD